MRSLSILTAGAAFSLLSGCASINASLHGDEYEVDPQDPFETENRAIYAFNDAVDRTLVKPVAETYKDNMPQPVQSCVRNMASNLKEPVRVVSHALTFNGVGVADSTVRFVLNTVVGWLGCFDAAGEGMGVKRNNSDLGLAARSILGGDQQVFVMLPLLGPSTFVDAGGTYLGSEYLDPLDATLPENEGGEGYYEDADKLNPYSTPRAGLRNTYLGIEALSTRADLLDVTDLVDTAALDPYAFVRDAYLERRAALAQTIRER